MNVLVLAAVVLAAAGPSQKQRCSPNGRRGPMACINRIGHCVAVTVDGQATVPLTDKATAARVHAVPHHVSVCWQLPRPVSMEFRAQARPDGLDPTFLGEIHDVDIMLYRLDDYDPQIDSMLDAIRGIRSEADGYRNGTWQVRPARPLAAGEYIALFRVSGRDNWDGQGVLLTVDPDIPPGPADEGRPAPGKAPQRK
jgi:hypothetical protein